jgi:N-acetylmuramoyl-L-alanine amidase
MPYQLRLTIRVFLALLACWITYPSLAASADITQFRLSADTDGRARLVFELTGPVNHSLFTLKSPERVVIDIEAVNLRTTLPTSVNDVRVLKRIRNAPRNNQDLRVVLDLESAAQPKSFLLRPDGEAGYRLVIDLFSQEKTPKATVVKSAPQPTGLRDLVIAIDAGHGGKDPGASGRRGTTEKAITLLIGRELAHRIQRERGMRPVMIRDGDYYMGLRDRIEKARLHKADLFISIHADAFHNPQARGSSVYALSLSGASSEAAQWLANRENAADLIGGVTLGDKDDMVASVLLDLSQTATIQASLDIGGEMLKQLGQHNKLHRDYVQQAGFLVLKSPDIPSVLVETAFISNLEEERKLADRAHQAKLAEAMLRGIKSYYSRKAPPGTLLAHENGKLRSGDKLSASTY